MIVRKPSKFFIFFSLLAILLTSFGCGGDSTQLDQEDKRNVPLSTNDKDLPGILKRGQLVILAENSSTSFFIYKGKKMGFEYEILREFAEELGVTLEVVIVNNLDEINSNLNNGDGDIIACNYTVTKERKKEIAFSIPFLQTPQVLVQRKLEVTAANLKKLPSTYISEPLQLARKKVDVWENSSYYNRLINLQNEIGDTIYIRPIQGHQSAEELIEMVSDGEIDYTVVEKNIALINERFYDNIDASLAISFKQNIAFGLRKEAPILNKRLNSWLKKFMQKETFSYIKRKYFEQIQQISSYQDEFHSSKRGGISPFDAVLKIEAGKYDFDWRLLAAIIYHESKFNPNARSFGGAYGLMQFMPGTGPKFGVFPTSSPEVQIKGGMKYLAKLNDFWSSIKDPVERNKFMLASYNAGAGHVKDAQKLAEKKGLNPNLWEENVEKMILNLGKYEYYSDPVVKSGALRGNVTYRYVRGIMSRYESYKSLAKP